MSIWIDFVKVHAGWDEILFLYGNQIPQGMEKEIGLSLLTHPSLQATELGILYQAQGQANLKVRMLDRTTNGFITMCGGLTQCLGKALIETDIGDRFGIPVNEPITKVTLETDAGQIPLRIEVKDGIATRVFSRMTSVVEGYYSRGVRKVIVDGIVAQSIGVKPPHMSFLVFNVDNLREKHPEIDFFGTDPQALVILRNLFSSFLSTLNGTPFLYAMLYDMHPERGGDARLASRFLPLHVQKGIESGCGTGTAAVALAMLENRDFNSGDGIKHVRFENGSYALLDTEQVIADWEMTCDQWRCSDAWINFNIIEIVAAGRVNVPDRILSGTRYRL